VIHHPLHIDREADYAIDPSFGMRVKRTLYFPLFMQQVVARRLARIVTVSEASRMEIERHFGIPEKAIPVVHNGTDLETFKPIPGTPVETDLLFVGRTDDRKKGIGTLLEALARLPDSVTLKIVDGRIGERSLVPRLLARHRLRHRVVMQRRLLTIPELVAEYSTARVAVVPSFFEGFGFPASEAMACGLPVVANAAGALPEVVGTDGQAGLLVAPRDPAGLAAAIQSVLADPARARRMGLAARARVAQLFRWGEAAERLVDVFEETRRAAHRRPRAA
jgi:glycosyltransferase involved in cell wall biosynthesis